MAIFCLPKHLVDKFLEKLKSGEINPETLSAMTSKERNDYFSSFLGSENATRVNAEFESKILLKSQLTGMINWAKNVTGIKEATKLDLVSKVNRMTEILKPADMNAFLSDLAEQRLKIGVTLEEAGRIADLAKTVADNKALIKEASPIGSDERMNYGLSLAVFKDYVGALKIEANKQTMKEFMLSPGSWIDQIGSITKSIAASFDNSFFGRQGFIALVSHPDIWIKDFAKSWGDMAKEIMGVDAMLPIKADVFSRPNAINGKYQAMGLEIGLDSEEAFPSALPSRIPILGRLYKASETAYNGAALRLRTDLADRLIEEAEAAGVDVRNKTEGIGRLINSMTGRGAVQMTQGQARFINVTMFSIKYLKSNLDVLTAHVFDKNVGAFARKQAANNILRTIGVMAAILAIAKLWDDDSVELDPRSANFGKILVGDSRKIKINISLGMGAIITLASRIVPTFHDGELGFWYKNAKGKYSKLGGDKYGATDPSDLIFSFMKGKASPLARLLLTTWEGKTFGGGKPTVEGEALNLVTPIPIGNLFDLAKSDAGADPLLYAILSALDFLGVGSSVSPSSNKNTKENRAKR